MPKLKAADLHELARCVDAESMALEAEMFYRASLERTESRGFHLREDFPDRDDARWLKWVIVGRTETRCACAPTTSPWSAIPTSRRAPAPEPGRRVSGKTRQTGRGLGITDLEQRSGVRRAVIYYYVHRGLLPRAQKASATRAIYTREHVELLARIAELKHEGLTLAQIRERLAARVEAGTAPDVDLVAVEARRRRDAILQEAARQFAARGYRRTRIADICGALVP